MGIPTNQLSDRKRIVLVILDPLNLAQKRGGVSCVNNNRTVSGISNGPMHSSSYPTALHRDGLYRITRNTYRRENIFSLCRNPILGDFPNGWANDANTGLSTSQIETYNHRPLRQFLGRLFELSIVELEFAPIPLDTNLEFGGKTARRNT